MIHFKAAGGQAHKYLLIFIELSHKVTDGKGFFCPITVVFQASGCCGLSNELLLKLMCI